MMYFPYGIDLSSCSIILQSSWRDLTALWEEGSWHCHTLFSSFIALGHCWPANTEGLKEGGQALGKPPLVASLERWSWLVLEQMLAAASTLKGFMFPIFLSLCCLGACRTLRCNLQMPVWLKEPGTGCQPCCRVLRYLCVLIRQRLQYLSPMLWWENAKTETRVR